MSKNHNRAKLKKANNNNEYRLLMFNFEYPPYYEEGWSVWKSRGTRRYKKKQLYKYQVRMYKTWKYNRKTQYKLPQMPLLVSTLLINWMGNTST